MSLTWKYYMLNYHNYQNASEFFDHVKSLKEQINATNVEITINKETLFYLIIEFWNEFYYQLLVQICDKTKDITEKKAWKILLKDKQNVKENFEVSILVICNQNIEANSYLYYGKTRYKENSFWKKYLKLISS